MRARQSTPEVKLRVAAQGRANAGRVRSEQSKSNISAAQKKRFSDLKQIAELSAKIKKYYQRKKASQ